MPLDQPGLEDSALEQQQPAGVPMKNSPAPAGNEPEAEKEMSFLDHLEELRWHIIRSFSAIFVFAAAAMLMKTFVFEYFIFGPKHADFPTYTALCWLSERLGSQLLCVQPPEFVIQNIDVMGQFVTHLKVSFVLGFILAFPYALWEVWRFVRPGLYDKEVTVTRGLTFFCSLLFLIGISFGYFIIVPFSLNFLVSYSIGESVSNEFNLTSYINFITMIVLAAGIMFELPMVIYFLAKLGIVNDEALKKQRKVAFVVILVASAIITPPDVTSQLLITFPVMGLYEIGIAIAKRVQPKPV